MEKIAVNYSLLNRGDKIEKSTDIYFAEPCFADTERARTQGERYAKENGLDASQVALVIVSHARKNESGERFTYSEIMEKTPQEANAIYASIVAHMAGVDIDPKPKSPKKKSSGAS